MLFYTDPPRQPSVCFVKLRTPGSSKDLMSSQSGGIVPRWLGQPICEVSARRIYPGPSTLKVLHAFEVQSSRGGFLLDVRCSVGIWIDMEPLGMKHHLQDILSPASSSSASAHTPRPKIGAHQGYFDKRLSRGPGHPICRWNKHVLHDTEPFVNCSCLATCFRSVSRNSAGGLWCRIRRTVARPRARASAPRQDWKEEWSARWVPK